VPGTAQLNIQVFAALASFDAPVIRSPATAIINPLDSLVDFLICTSSDELRKHSQNAETMTLINANVAAMFA
jgi:hypothetical protein